MILIYVDIILLIILIALTLFSFCFCLYQMKKLHEKGKVTILVNQRKALFARDEYGEASLKSASWQSGDCAAYEELREPAAARPPHYRAPDYRAPDYRPPDYRADDYRPPDYRAQDSMTLDHERASPLISPTEYNRVSRTRDWRYTEYQI